MALMEWKDELSVGVAAMDAEHQAIIGAINELNEAMRSRRADEELGRIFHKLLRYAQTHFAAEECFLESIGYPGIEAHRSEHATLVRHLFQLQREHKAGRLLMGNKLMGFLRKWLTNHILQSDMRYGEWAKQRVGS